MLLAKSMLIAGATQTIRWNPSDKGSGAVLSNGDTQLSSSGGITGARVTKVIPTGKKIYAEFTDITASVTVTSCGIGTVAAGFGTGVGNDVFGYGYWQGTGVLRHNGADAVTGGEVYTSGDVIGCAVDTINSRIWFSKNGVWQFGGDPTTVGTGYIIGTDPCYFMAVTSSTPSGRWGINATPRYAPPMGFALL